MRGASIAGAIVVFTASLLTCASARDVAPVGAWIDKYEAVRCDPHRVSVAAHAPLRFAIIGHCDGVPREWRMSFSRQLVTVDTVTNEVRTLRLGANDLEAGSLLPDAIGNWHWLTAAGKPARQIEAWELAPGQHQPRSLGTVSIDAGIPPHSFARRGDRCWLVSAAQYNDHRMLELTGFFLVSIVDGELRVRAVEGLLGTNFWHPLERAFVVRVRDGNRYALLDCAGSRRALSAGDLERLEMHGDAPMRVSATGDWAYSSSFNDSSHGMYWDDEIHVLRQADQRQFGPFGKPEKGCPDIACIWDTDALSDPSWSDSGKFLLVQGFPRSFVLRASDLGIVRKWRSAHGKAVFLTESLVMGLSKNHGVNFHRW